LNVVSIHQHDQAAKHDNELLNGYEWSLVNELTHIHSRLCPTVQGRLPECSHAPGRKLGDDDIELPRSSTIVSTGTVQSDKKE
jgi:hypothetical protein